MAHKLIDRCKETTSTTGTGTLTLTGAVTGYVAMADATGGLTTDGDTSYFIAENGAEWELFLGTRVDSTHLARTTVIKSSNAGAAVSFTAAPAVFSAAPAEKISAVGPAFRAYRSVDQTGLANTTYVKVAFDAEDFDTSGCFDSTTNNRFTPNVAGYYDVSWGIVLSGTTLTVGFAALYKNGALAAEGSWGATNLGVAISTGATLIYMNGTTDYLEVFAYTTASSGNRVTGGVAKSHFEASFVRGG